MVSRGRWLDLVSGLNQPCSTASEHAARSHLPRIGTLEGREKQDAAIASKDVHTEMVRQGHERETTAQALCCASFVEVWTFIARRMARGPNAFWVQGGYLLYPRRDSNIGRYFSSIQGAQQLIRL